MANEATKIRQCYFCWHDLPLSADHCPHCGQVGLEMNDSNAILSRPDVWVCTDGPGWGLENLPVSVKHVSYRSATIHREVGYCIALPPSYEAARHRRYPCIVHLHGGGGCETTDTLFAAWYDSLSRQSKLPEAIILFPNGLRWSSYADSKDNRFPIHRMIMEELIPQVQAEYRLKPFGVSWLVQGMSMGGGGALLCFLKQAGKFGNVICFAPAFPDGKKVNEWAFKHMYGEDAEYGARFSTWQILESIRAPLVKDAEVLLLMGDSDLPTMRESCERMTQRLVSTGLKTTYHCSKNCGHNLWELIKSNQTRLVEYYVEKLSAKAKDGE